MRFRVGVWIGSMIVIRGHALCDAVHGQDGVFMPESLYHMLISCPHVRMEALRVKLKVDLGALLFS